MRWQGKCGLGLVYGIVLLLPVAWVLVQAFAPGPREEIARVVEQTDIAGRLANSMLLALLCSVLAVALGLPLALLLNLREFPGRTWIGRLYFLPLVIPPHIHTIAWNRVMGNQGWLTYWLRDTWGYTLDIRAALGNPDTDALFGHVYPGPAWVMACAYFPLVTLSTSAGIRALDPVALDAARLIGGRKMALRQVILPQVFPRVVAGATFVFLLGLATYPVVSLLDTPVLIRRVFSTLSQAHGREAAAAVLSLPLVFVGIAAVFGLGLIERTLDTRQSAGRIVAARGGLRPFLLVGLILAVAVGVPFSSLVWEAGPLHLSGDVKDNYQSVVERVDEAFLDSLLTTGAGVVALVLLSWPLGRALSRGRGGWLDMVGLGSLAFPPEVIGVALLLFWSELASSAPVSFLAVCGVVIALPALLRRESAVAGLALAGAVVCAFLFLDASGVASYVQKRGIALVVIAYLARFLPFTVRLFRNGFRSLDPDEDHAARLCGQGVLSRTLHVQAPRMRGVVASAVVMGWVLCFTELPATLLTYRPGWQNVQVRVFNMVHYQSIGEVAALCVLVVVMACLPVVVLSLFAARKESVL